ncbi:hypothetical protein LguiA_022045 [Lonicera macranthoides]
MSEYIPPEVIVNILSWLPSRSLLRFKCVCKSWCSIISSPNFIDIHTSPTRCFFESQYWLTRHALDWPCKLRVVNIGYERMGDGSQCNEVRIYSIKEGAWRRISAPAPPYDIVNNMPSNVVINGSLHWIANQEVSGTSDFLAINPLNVFDTVDDLKNNSIMVFDTVEEVFHEIMLPKSLVSIATHNLCLMVIGGSLSVIQYEKFLNLRSIWVMKKDGAVESWSEKHSFDSD